MALINKLSAIGDAIREKTGKADKLTLDQMPLEIAGIETGGGGSMESGELTTTSAHFWQFSIPVSSKKTHVLVYPKSIKNMFTTNDTSRIRAFFAEDGNGKIEIAPAGTSTTDEVMNGAAYWSTSANSTATVFTDNSINVTMRYSPWAIGDYYWFAW